MPITEIPKFHFPNGKPSIKHEQHIRNVLITVKQIYNNRQYLTESQFIPVSKACGLPRYLNMTFFRKLETLGRLDMRVAFSTFTEGWISLTRNRFDEESLFFNILKKPGSQWISAEDFLPVLQDVVLNHPGIKFLGDNPMFQERYIETVICRIYYEGKCTSGRMKLSHFRNCNFANMIKNLGPNVDLNNTRDCFSYKHFYVLYCKFWVLDEDHDLIISEDDMLDYNDGLLSPNIIRQIIHHGRIPAFAREKHSASTLTYLDYIWFFLSETDKSTLVAIEYWFRCMDEDGDGIITTYDLSEHWKEQERKLQNMLEFYGDESIRFDDIICQMNDLIQPQVPGQFRLCELKRNGIIAERFFDTFLNIEKFQIHDTHQGLIRAIHQLEKEKKMMYESHRQKNAELRQKLLSTIDCDDEQAVVITDAEQENMQNQQQFQQPFTLGAWCDYAEQEYDLLVVNEQCGSVDSDWSVRNIEHEDQFDEELVLSERYDDGSRIRVTVAVEQQASNNWAEGNDEDEKSESLLQESSDDHESDSSAPCTPVTQELADNCNDKDSLNENDRKLPSDDEKACWIWHSVNE